MLEGVTSIPGLFPLDASTPAPAVTPVFPGGAVTVPAGNMELMARGGAWRPQTYQVRVCLEQDGTEQEHREWPEGLLGPAVCQGPSDKGTCESRPGWSEERCSQQRDSPCKGPGVGGCWTWLKQNKS